MEFDAFLTRVINEGIEGARVSYTSQAQKPKLDGSIAGFEACRGKSVSELKLLLEASQTASEDARRGKERNYWWYRCYESEVEWVCNCVSAALMNSGQPPIIPPTARGLMKAASILGVNS